MYDILELRYSADKLLAKICNFYYVLHMENIVEKLLSFRQPFKTSVMVQRIEIKARSILLFPIRNS